MSYSHVPSSLARVKASMAAAAERVGRDPSSVQLVAVSKQHPIEAIRAAYDAGQRCFGESRAQELRKKAAALPADVEWHFIGPLQRNKVNQVRPLVRLLHSVDRIELAKAWGSEGDVPALVQVRLGGEASKSGFEPEEFMDRVNETVALGVRVAGVMSIPPPATDLAGTRHWFRILRELSEQLTDAVASATVISMGMSQDYEIAIEEGASAVRVGTAIFGTR